jgi:hypothetical protein
MKALTFISIPLFLLFAVSAFANYGTDTSGTYAWADSNESWGPSYNWIDASGGTNLGIGDDSYYTTSTPFAISYYGVNHASGSSYYVGTNGMMSWSSAGMTSLSPTNLPNAATPNDMIAVYWDDQIGFSGDHLYSYVSGSAPDRIWVISYDPWHKYYISGNPLQFQVLIFENDGSFDNLILLQYKDTTAGDSSDHGAGETAGIENSNGTQGHAYCYYSGNLTENKAVAYVGMGGLVANSFALLTPANGSTILVPPKKGTGGVTVGAADSKGSVDVTFTWENNGVKMDDTKYSMVQYELLIDDDPGFGSPDYDITGIAGVQNPSQTVTITVSGDTTFYWRVIASNPYFSQVDDVQCDADFSFNLDNPPYTNILPSSVGKVRAIFE